MSWKQGLLIILACGVLLIWSQSCTEQQRARNFGEDITVDLPVNEKLINVTWKEDNIWYLTKPMTEDDIAEEYKFSVSSSWGIFEGTVTIVEHKKTSIDNVNRVNGVRE